MRVCMRTRIFLHACIWYARDQPDDCGFGVQYKPGSGPAHPKGNCDLIPKNCFNGLKAFKKCTDTSTSVYCKNGGWTIVGKDVFTSAKCAHVRAAAGSSGFGTYVRVAAAAAAAGPAKAATPPATPAASPIAPASGTH